VHGNRWPDLLLSQACNLITSFIIVLIVSNHLLATVPKTEGKKIKNYTITLQNMSSGPEVARVQSPCAHSATHPGPDGTKLRVLIGRHCCLLDFCFFEVRELGGEDAKITYFTNGIEQRMNGTCAGETGAFIDQMVALLKTDGSSLNDLCAQFSDDRPDRRALRCACQNIHPASYQRGHST
jgi:hypothetical protein